MTAEAIASVLAALERDEEFLLHLTQQLVRIPTVNPKFEASIALNHEADLQHYLRVVLDGFGMRTESHDVFPSQPNLTASLPGGAARSLILCAHVDVVKVGDRRAWSANPFGGDIVGRRLYGRGALATKSGLAAAIAVARAITRAGVALDGQLELHAVVDGEADGFGARDLLGRGMRAAGVIVLEPTGQALLPAACGRDCVRVTLRGRGAQSGWRGAALPAPDVNAVEFAVRFVTAVQQLERDWTTRKPPHPLLPPGLNTIQPGAMLCGVGMGANGLPEVLTDPTSTPDVAVVDFELKFLPNEDPGEVRQEFENFVHAFAQQDSWLRAHPPDVRWDLYGLQVPPLNTPTDHPLCAAVIDSRAARKLPTEIKGFVGFCDAAHYAGAGIPAVIFGPGGGGLRAADEYVDLDSLRAVAKTLAAVAVRWCGVK